MGVICDVLFMAIFILKVQKVFNSDGKKDRSIGTLQDSNCCRIVCKQEYAYMKYTLI